MDITISKRKRWKAAISLPGDKSMSHRALMFPALARGKSRISHVLLADDCMSTKRCMEALGASYRQTGSDSFEINGEGIESLKEPKDILNAGNSGTTMRLLSGILAGLRFFSCITGDSSLNNRPMKRVIEPLTFMGASIWARGGGQFAPMAFKGGGLTAIEYSLPVASAQVKSAILLAGLLAEGETKVIEPFNTRDHTEHMLKAMGAELSVAGRGIVLQQSTSLSPLSLRIPGDFSSAAFFIGACLPLTQGRILIDRVGINPTRTGLLEIFGEMGAEISLENVTEDLPGEPCGDLLVRHGSLSAVTLEGEIIPRVIDELPLLAVIATQAEGVTVVRGAGELRVKESDRIKAIVTELKKMGAQIDEEEDGFSVRGPVALKGCVCESHGDHRIAMSLAIAGLFAEGETVIRDADCVAISFPEFFQILNSGEIE
jgi:3-phosphoshikimate 1-carboxyvinyltransferase